MLQLPAGFTHGEVTCARRVTGVTLAEVVYPPHLRVPRHTHADARFVLVLRGSFVEDLPAGSLTHAASTLLFRPAGGAHGITGLTGGAQCLIVEMQASWLVSAGDEGCILGEAAEFRGGLLLHLARRLHGEFRSRDEVSRLVISGLVLGVAAEASRRVAKLLARPSAPPSWLQKAHDLVHEGFARGPTLAEVAATVGVHPVHLARSFRRWYQCTIGEYVRERRLEFACREMAGSDASLAEIALAAGFCDQSHLTRLCKERLGMTPSAYRAIHRPGVVLAPR